MKEITDLQREMLKKYHLDAMVTMTPENITYVTGAYMGITVKDNDKEAAAQFGLPTDGAYVVDVTPGSSADKAGIQSKDLITAVDDHKITTRTDLTRTLRNYKAGDTAEITVVRSGRELTLTDDSGTARYVRND